MWDLACVWGLGIVYVKNHALVWIACPALLGKALGKRMRAQKERGGIVSIGSALPLWLWLYNTILHMISFRRFMHFLQSSLEVRYNKRKHNIGSLQWLGDSAHARALIQVQTISLLNWCLFSFNMQGTWGVCGRILFLTFKLFWDNANIVHKWLHLFLITISCERKRT